MILRLTLPRHFEHSVIVQGALATQLRLTRSRETHGDSTLQRRVVSPLRVTSLRCASLADTAVEMTIATAVLRPLSIVLPSTIRLTRSRETHGGSTLQRRVVSPLRVTSCRCASLADTAVEMTIGVSCHLITLRSTR